MTALEARKQLLIAESGVHRALLGRDFEEITAAAHALAGQGRRAAKLAASVALLLGARLALGRRRGDGAAPRRPPLRRLLGWVLRNIPLWMEILRTSRSSKGSRSRVPAEPGPAGGQG